MPRKPRATGYLGELREQRELSQQQTVNALLQFGIKLGKSALSRYETGSRESPDPLVLWGLSKIYKEPLEKILLHSRGRQDLASAPVTVSSTGDIEDACLILFRRLNAATKREVLEFLQFKAGSAKPLTHAKGAA